MLADRGTRLVLWRLFSNEIIDSMGTDIDLSDYVYRLGLNGTWYNVIFSDISRSTSESITFALNILS